ncbi:MAG TPA: hypothetical protein DEB06_02120, partial [Phycisphaerales bacterium]|nr:hypothetical protein [Phycisphaerales bacterium]
MPGEALPGPVSAPPPGGRGFWADAWARVLRRPGAVLGLAWIGVVGFFAVVAPVLASGHPVLMREIDPP